MAVGLKGIRLESLSLQKDGDKTKLVGRYELVSTDDKVLATQTFNQYGGMEISPSPATLVALDALKKSFQADVSAHVGLASE